MCPCETEGEIENNFVLFIWWFHRRWWGLSSPSAAVCTRTHTHTHTHTHSYFLSTLHPSPPVLPAVHLSSRPSLSDDSPRSVPPLLSLRNVIFHFWWILFGLWALSSSSFFFFCATPSPRLSASVAPPPLPPVTTLTIISPDKTSQRRRCAEERKTELGRALIPGIWDSPFRPGQNEPRSVWFGQCYSCLSKWPQVPGRFEEKSTQTRAGTGLSLTTIFESFLPSKAFWFKRTHAASVFALSCCKATR